MNPENQLLSSKYSENVAKLRYLILCLLAFTIPCFIYAAPAVTILFALVWLVEGKLKAKFSAFIHNKYALLFAGFYAIHLLGMLYTPYVHAGWFDMQVKVSLILFPLLLVSGGKMEFKQQQQLIGAFIAGLVVNGLICLIHALWQLYAKNIFEFQYAQFSLFLHPSYYSMYIDLGVVLIFYLLAENKKMKGSTGEKVFLYLSFFFLEFIVVLLQSKAGLIISATVIVIVLLRYLSKQNPWPTAIVVVGGIVLLYFLPYHYIVTSGRSRILSAGEILEKEKLSDTSSESTQVRIYINLAALKLVKTGPILGSGTGSVHQVLENEYVKEGMLGAMKKRLNAHNQYMETALELGVPALLLFLASLLVPFYLAIRQKRFVYSMFLYIFIMNIIVESMLEVQSGTIYYGFFNALFMFNLLI